MRSFFTENESLADKNASNRHDVLMDKNIKCKILDFEFSDINEEKKKSPIPVDDELICFPQQDMLIPKNMILREIPRSDFDNLLLFSFVSDPLNWIGLAVVETVIHKHDKTIILNAELKYIYVKPEHRKKAFSQLMAFYLGTLVVTPLSQDDDLHNSKTKNISIIGSGQSSEYYGPKTLESFFWGLELESNAIDTDVIIDLDFTDDL